MDSNTAKLALIGVGAMGRAWLQGMISQGVFSPDDIVVTDADSTRATDAVRDMGVQSAASNAEAVRDAATIIIAVKPDTVGSVLDEISPAITPTQMVVSIAAGISTQSIESHLPSGVPVVRVMPNTPALVGAGAAGFARGSHANPEHAERVAGMLSAVGVAIEVPEKLLNAVTGLSGSGPAYVYTFIEALSDAGVSVGLPRATASVLAAQTVLGAAKMVVETREHPAKLRDAVTSPGGTTIAGLAALERDGLRTAIFDAVQAATKRAQELAGSSQ